MQLLSQDRLMCARYRFVQYAALCHYRPFVYVSGVPDWVKTCHRLYDTVSPCRVLHIHKETDGNDIRAHTAQIYNECTSTDLNLATA
jgi:hypothetical protein